MELNWNRVLRYIEKERAALMIGPEISLINGLPIHNALHAHLKERHEDSIALHYVQDELLLFEGEIEKNDAILDIKDFFDQHPVDEKVYRMLAEMKFHLYVSMNPDTYLSDTFYRYGIKHRFNYFRSSSLEDINQIDNFREVEQPTQEYPLVYNMMGSKDDDESLILDYDDVFNLIAFATNPNGLPSKLRVALKKVKLFIFLGFPFEKWYTKLLLRLLCGTSETAKYALNRQAIQETTQDFLVHQFNVEFIPEYDNMLEVLYDQCKSHGLLRELADPLKEDRVLIIKYVQNGDIERALNELDEQDGETIQLKARYSRWLENKEKGTEDSRDLLVEYNKIIDSILSIISIVH